MFYAGVTVLNLIACCYLQHDLTLSQLAKVIGTNRSYLSQYFVTQGITYNTYIYANKIQEECQGR